MMGKSVSLFIFVAIFFLLDLYVWQSFKTSFKSGKYFEYLKFVYFLISAINVGLILAVSFLDFQSWPKITRNGVTAFWFVFYAPKLVIATILFGEDLIRIFKVGVNKLLSAPQFDPSRKEFISKVAVGAAGLLAGGLLYGVLRGAYVFNVIHQKIRSPKIPKSFDGFKIIQLSDIHTGSFISERFLENCVEKINALEPDMVLFTGDLVNYKADEAYPFVETLKKIKAKHGVFSILGNHDYGDYVKWNSQEEKINNLKAVHHIHKNMLGWDLLINENRTIEKNGEKITLLGVENWSAKGNFPKYGKLNVALNGVNPNDFQILMSHDPSHWKAEVLGKTNIDLTLSGHTHGMQFGIEIPGWLKLSPVSLVYKEWAGLYKNSEQKLYVNRGLGFLGYPGRLGISPEITVLELEA